jgi:photosynthetic reaction center cytochrome c subunit
MSSLSMSPFRLTLTLLAIVTGTLLAFANIVRWERPPMQSTQLGYRGTGMAEIENPRTAAALAALNKVPAPQDAVAPAGTLSSAVYKNVTVLGDLDSDEFLRYMAAITEWVSPEQGCTYCHNPENLADDSVYTKIVARRMIQMVRHVNNTWKPHVQATGVTCYTCHRGHPVPQNVWYKNDGPAHARGMSASRQGQNVATKAVGSTSLPYDPFSTLLVKDSAIRVESTTALPAGNAATIKDTEKTYALMMHMSQSLGVNCTFCHNSRHFSDWSQSRPQRVTAWHGIKMASDLNAAYLEPLTPNFPPNRLGVSGDVAKINCATCHQGVNKPLLGVSMLKDYPGLATPNP